MGTRLSDRKSTESTPKLTPGDRVRHINPGCVLHACHGTIVEEFGMSSIPGTVLVNWDEPSSPTFDTGSSRIVKAELTLGCDRYPARLLQKIPADQRSVCVLAASPLTCDLVDRALLDAEVTAREVVALPDTACFEAVKGWAKAMNVPAVRFDGVHSAVDYLLSPTNAWAGAIVAVTGGQNELAKRVMAAALGRHLNVKYVNCKGFS